jgi:hypothetical protein
MTTRFKDFGSGSVSNSEPILFKLHGEDFTCYPALQGKVLLEMASMSNSNDPSGAAKVMYEFFKKCMHEESYTRFTNLLENPETIVTVETLGEIAGWLTEQYAGRPQPGPELSASGQ